MHHQLAPHQARALRAAAAVTGRARRLSAPAALASALVMPLGACGHSDAPLPEWTLNANDTTPSTTAETTPGTTSPNTSPNTTSQTTPTTTAPTAPGTTSNPSDAPPNCVSEAGETDWRCCDDHAHSETQALGCDMCPTPYDDSPSDCLSCWHLNGAQGEGFEAYNACCAMFEDDMPRKQQAGCAPWGPPAPPRMRGATIVALLGLPTREVHHACA